MDCVHSGKELRGSGFGGILQACRAEHHWRSRGALGTFGYIWIHLDTFGASTFDAAFDAYVLARVTRSCLAVRARVSLTYDWQALQQELELARTPRWHPSFCDFDTLTAFDDALCNALRARQAAEAEDAAEVSEPWHVSLVPLQVLFTTLRLQQVKDSLTLQLTQQQSRALGSDSENGNEMPNGSFLCIIESIKRTQYLERFWMLLHYFAFFSSFEAKKRSLKPSWSRYEACGR